ncbi:MAG TPA: calcium-translocating P-type ATPase, PMCA-type [Burkholderiales bacterium]|nr:calcium-translocating P-type ATPase, PMCA-type [Burkholderiales bacterium]
MTSRFAPRQAGNDTVSPPPAWHCLDSGEIARTLGTDPAQGLTAEAAVQRLARYGRNELREGRRRAPWRILLDQFADFMIVVLIAAAVVSGVIGEPQDTIAIFAILVLNAVIGFVQEYRAERAMAALKRIAAPSASVLRTGRRIMLPVHELVPGDVVLLEAGNVVPADLRLTEAVRLRVNESALTGESAPVEKSVAALRDADAPLGDRRNMGYKGTIVSYGRGRGIVVASGMATELGRIATLLAGEEGSKTPLQKRLTRFGSRLAIAVLAICAIIFITGLLRGEPPVLMFLTAVSLAVAAIPEALPAVVTISLALGAYKMVQKNALIRRLPAVETLGSITYICSDKTGTLTENRMRVEVCYAGGMMLRPDAGANATAQRLFTAMALCNDVIATGGGISGDPTEVALYEAAARAGFDKAMLEAASPRLAELPFDSERKRMTTFHRLGDEIVAFSKGAPETLLRRCAWQLDAAGRAPLDRDSLDQATERMAADGLRVLAVAYRAWPELPDLKDGPAIERDLVFVGLVGMIDPPRREAEEAVAMCRSAGITPVMITGDHPATARAVARRLGIIADGGEVMTGRQLAHLSDEDLAPRIQHVRVYARVDPEQKIRIVRTLQERGEYVAMTGDGVNDAPALKRADIGVAMGRGGTDVAREAADMVLLDDNFATIVSAVRAGRRIYDNIRRFIKYALTTNSGEIWIIFLAPFLGLPIPLLPLHILWINLVTDGLPGLALAAEPEERGIMKRPPRPPQESIFAHGMWQHIIWVGLLMGGIVLGIQAWAYHAGSAHWQSMVFTALTLAQLAHVLAIRSERDSLFSMGLWSNRLLLVAVVATTALQLAILYVPALNRIFKTAPLDAGELALCVAGAAAIFAAVEIEKWMVRNSWLYGRNTAVLPKRPHSA